MEGERRRREWKRRTGTEREEKRMGGKLEHGRRLAKTAPVRKHRFKVASDHQSEVAYALSIGIKINDLS